MSRHLLPRAVRRWMPHAADRRLAASLLPTQIVGGRTWSLMLARRIEIIAEPARATGDGARQYRAHGPRIEWGVMVPGSADPVVMRGRAEAKTAWEADPTGRRMVHRVLTVGAWREDTRDYR